MDERASRPVSDGRAEEASDGRGRPVLDHGDELSSRWEALQVSFVDEPRRTVEEADALITDTIQAIADTFVEQRDALRAQWRPSDDDAASDADADSEGDRSTEDLRLVLQRYRTLFDRLLSVS